MCRSSECSSLESESAKLSELESGFWREYEEYALQLQQLTDEQAHVKNQIKNASETLDRSGLLAVADEVSSKGARVARKWV